MNSLEKRSTFVTVLAWIFIVLSSWSALIGLLQNVMIATVFTDAEFSQAFQQAPPGMPAAFSFMFEHFYLFFALFFVISIFTLAISIGLLKRKDWARKAFIVLMVLGVIWSVLGLILQLIMMPVMSSQFSQLPDAPNMKPFFITMAIVSVAFAAGFCTLYIWIIKRLMSAPIKLEFSA